MIQKEIEFMTSVVSPSKTAHDPFHLRRAIVLGAAVAGLVGGFFVHDYAVGFALYGCLVPFLDFLVHRVFSLKSSTYADLERLRVHEEVSGPELDRYHHSRYHIRLLSLSLAGASQLCYASLPLFCGLYALATVVGIVYVGLRTDIKTPRLFHGRPLTIKELDALMVSSFERNYDDISLSNRSSALTKDRALGHLGIGLYAFLKVPDVPPATNIAFLTAEDNWSKNPSGQGDPGPTHDVWDSSHDFCSHSYASLSDRQDSPFPSGDPTRSSFF